MTRGLSGLFAGLLKNVWLDIAWLNPAGLGIIFDIFNLQQTNHPTSYAKNGSYHHQRRWKKA